MVHFPAPLSPLERSGGLFCSLESVHAFSMDTLWSLSMAVAMVAGTFTGSLHDPIFYLFLAVAIACGASRWRWILLPPIALLLAIIRAGVAYQRYASVLGDVAASRLMTSMISQSIIFLVVIFVARGISRLIRR